MGPASPFLLQKPGEEGGRNAAKSTPGSTWRSFTCINIMHMPPISPSPWRAPALEALGGVESCWWLIASVCLGVVGWGLRLSAPSMLWARLALCG